MYNIIVSSLSEKRTHAQQSICVNKGERNRRSRKTKYLFFNKLTLELVGVLEALTVDLDGGAVSLSDVTQTLLLQLSDLWDLVFTTSTKSADKHGPLDLRIYCTSQTTCLAILSLSS